MFGYASPDEAIGRNVLEFVAEEERKRAVAAMELTLEEGTSDVGEYALVRKDGSVFPGEIHGQAMRDASGNPVGLVITSRDISERKAAEEQLREYTERLRELRTQLDRATEDERRRIARELHDQVSQNLTALSITAGAVGAQAEARMPEVREHISECQALIEETAAHIRDLTFELRPPVLDDFGLAAAIEWFAGRTLSSTGLKVEVRAKGMKRRLPADSEMALFRIVQEAVTNVAKHAEASQVIVTIEESKGVVRVQIDDDGTGFDASRLAGVGESGSWGLLNMRERAEAIGGTFSVESMEAGGTRVAVEVRR